MPQKLHLSAFAAEVSPDGMKCLLALHQVVLSNE